MSNSGASQSDFTYLFGARSDNVHGPVFRVFPGHIWQFQAFDFLAEAFRDDPVLTPSFKQEACLNQIVFDSSNLKPTFGEDCTMKNYSNLVSKGGIIAEGPVLINGCCLCLDACNTMAFLDMPGDYRFVLNDQTALQTVKIVARWYNKDLFPFGVAGIFGRS